MTKYAKAITAVVGLIATVIFANWGEKFGLPPGWPETFTTSVVPLLTALGVYLIPNAE